MASKKIVVILEGAKDWNPWIQTIRTTAVNEGVWDLIDPEKWSSPEGDTTDEAVANPLPGNGTPGQAPRQRLRYTGSKRELVPKPEYPLPEDVDPQKFDIADLTTKELATYKFMKSLYKDEETRAVRKMTSLSQIHSRILETVDIRHHAIFEDSMNVREVLVALQARFKKTEHGKEQEVRETWNKLMAGSKGMMMDHWLDDCLTTYQRGKKLDLEFTAKSNAAHAFLLALPKGYQREIMIDRFNKDKDAGKTVKLEDLIRKYRIKYNDFISQSAKETPGSAFVTLNGQSPEERKQGSSKDRTGDPKQKRSKDVRVLQREAIYKSYGSGRLLSQSTIVVFWPSWYRPAF